MNKLKQVIPFAGLSTASRRTSSANATHRKPAMHLAICLLCVPALTLAQTQLGTDIDGEAGWDHSGTSVSLSSNGSRLAVGAPRNSGNGSEAGHVRVFQWSGTDWMQMGDDIDGEAAYNLSGESVSLSADGSRVVIGAQSNFGNGEYSGQVRVFQWSGSSWEQMGTDIYGEANDHFGRSVSISADGTRVAGTSLQGGDAGDSFGYVSVFQWSGSDWVQLGAEIDGKATLDRIDPVSLSDMGDRVAFGAGGVAGDTGQARVYEWSGSTWIQLGADIDGEALGDGFGASLALSGDGTRLAVGGPANDGNGPWAGHVRVFEWSGGSWVQLGADLDGDTRENWFGKSVSLSSAGKRLAVGAVSKVGGGDYTGVARAYQWSGTAWVQVGTDLDGEAEGDAFGESVALSSNGNRLAAGAPQNDANGGTSGHVRVFSLTEFNVFQINPGLNDAWYYLPTDGQGFFITVFPDLGKVNLAWFTYDTEQPPQDATANLGDPGHRWLTALGRYTDDQATLRITFASGGLFDTPAIDAPVTRIKDGTIVLTFDSCASGTAEYDIPSLGLSGIVPIERVVGDNVAWCEALLSQMSPW